MNAVVLDPVCSLPLIIAGAVMLTGLFCFWALALTRQLSPARRGFLTVCRLTGLLLLVVLFLQPSRLIPQAPGVTDTVTLVGIDTSRSMRQTDAGGLSRLEAAMACLRDAELLPTQSGGVDPALRFFVFDEEATVAPSLEVSSGWVSTDWVSTGSVLPARARSAWS